MYILSIIAVLHISGSINYSAVLKLTGGLLNLSCHMGGFGIAIGLFMLLVQYALLIVQGLIAYPSIVRERLSRNSNDTLQKLEQERAAALSTVAERQRVLEDTRRETVKKHLTLAYLNGDQSAIMQARSNSQSSIVLDETVRDIVGATDVEKDIERVQAEGWIEKSDSIVAMRLAELKASEAATERSAENYRLFLRDTPERQALFRWSEYGLDGLRLFPPGIVAATSLVALLARGF